MAQKRVLIVDDEAETRTVLREFLEQAGYASAEAANGLEALAQAERLLPHAILLDIRMPDLDGFEVCRRLKANPGTKLIPVIIVTAVQNDTLNRLAYEVGALACIVKPLRLEAVLATVRTVIASTERRAQRRAKREGNPP
jgi:CheY-like chemotaxis protein